MKRFLVLFLALPCAVLCAQNIDELKALADKGDAEAQYKLAFCYEAGEGVEKDDATAFLWGKKAAEQGHAKAQNLVGVLLEGGLGGAGRRLGAVQPRQLLRKRYKR